MTIILDDICKSFDDTLVLNKLNVSIDDGKSYAFVGPSGSGKSTALKSAYVSQEGQLNMKKSAIWNVKKVHRWATKGRAIEELSRFIPKEKMEIPVSELSDVDRRLVELVRAFFVPADFIVLDEPFRGMNEELKQQVISYIFTIQGNRPLLIAQQEENGLEFAKKIRL